MFSPEQLQTLVQVSNASASKEAVYLNAEQGMDLAQAGYIEVDANNTHPDNDKFYACAITPQGIQYLQTVSNLPSDLPQVGLPVQEPPKDPFPVSKATPSSVVVQQAPVAAPVWTNNPQTIPTNEEALPSEPVQPAQEVPQQVEQQANPFRIEKDKPRPARSNVPSGNPTAGSQSKYPYQNLEIGDSFFVPDTASPKGDAHKMMQASVASMNRKYRVPKIVGYDNGRPIHSPLMKNGEPVLDANGQKKFQMINTKRFRSYKIDQVSVSEPVLGARVYREMLKSTDVHVEPQ